jgi:hypothetical protein
MSSFRRYGGLNYSANNNITKSYISNSEQMNINNYSGQQNSNERFSSNIDLTGNSLLHTGTIFFEDGTYISSAAGIGSTGPTGSPGLLGPVGPTGDQGIPGPKGDVGPTGEQGLLGPVGPTGDQGIPGPKGDVGPTGQQGKDGDDGSTGPSGDLGPIGPTGDQGKPGPKGDVGPTGQSGPTGDNYWTLNPNDNSLLFNGPINIPSVIIGNNTSISSFGTDVKQFDCAFDSVSYLLKDIVYCDFSNNVWFSDTQDVSSDGIIYRDFTKINTDFSGNTSSIINDIACSKDLDVSATDITIAFILNRAGSGINNALVSASSNDANIAISNRKDSFGNFIWTYFRYTWYVVKPNSISVSPDGNNIYIGGGDNDDWFFIVLNWVQIDEVWGWVLNSITNATSPQVLITAVSINNSYGVNITQDSETGVSYYNFVENIQDPSFNPIFLGGNTASVYGSGLALSKNTKTLEDPSYLSVSINDWAIDNTSDGKNMSISCASINPDSRTVIGLNTNIKINNVNQIDNNFQYKCYGVDVSPNQDIIVVSYSYGANNISDRPPSDKILISIDYGYNFYTFIEANGKNFKRVKLIPNPNTGLYDGSLLVYDASSSQIYQYNYIGIEVNGNVNVSGLVSASNYLTSSDYRIKKDVTNVLPGVIDHLNPVYYNNILTKRYDMGFIAHELQKEFPFLVLGEKDGPEYQTVNYIGLIALLVKEVQELKKKVYELENNK